MARYQDGTIISRFFTVEVGITRATVGMADGPTIDQMANLDMVEQAIRYGANYMMIYEMKKDFEITLECVQLGEVYNYNEELPCCDYYHKFTSDGTKVIAGEPRLPHKFAKKLMIPIFIGSKRYSDPDNGIPCDPHSWIPMESKKEEYMAAIDSAILYYESSNFNA